MELEGKCRNSLVYVYEDYIYYKNTMIRNIQYFTCSTPACPARAKSVEGTFSVTVVHNHVSDPIESEELLIVAGCKRRASLSTEGLRAIFDAECAR